MAGRIDHRKKTIDNPVRLPHFLFILKVLVRVPKRSNQRVDEADFTMYRACLIQIFVLHIVVEDFANRQKKQAANIKFFGTIFL